MAAGEVLLPNAGESARSGPHAPTGPAGPAGPTSSSLRSRPSAASWPQQLTPDSRVLRALRIQPPAANGEPAHAHAPTGHRRTSPVPRWTTPPGAWCASTACAETSPGRLPGWTRTSPPGWRSASPSGPGALRLTVGVASGGCATAAGQGARRWPYGEAPHGTVRLPRTTPRGAMAARAACGPPAAGCRRPGACHQQPTVPAHHQPSTTPPHPHTSPQQPSTAPSTPHTRPTPRRPLHPAPGSHRPPHTPAHAPLPPPPVHLAPGPPPLPGTPAPRHTKRRPSLEGMTASYAVLGGVTYPWRLP